MMRKEAPPGRESSGKSATPILIAVLGISLGVLFWVLDAIAGSGEGRALSEELLYPEADRILLRLAAAAAFISLAILIGILDKRYRIALREARQSALTAAQRQGAAQTSQTNLRKVVDGIPDGVFHTTPDGSILSANEIMGQMLGGVLPDELRGSIFRYLKVESPDRERVEVGLRDGKSSCGLHVSLKTGKERHQPAVANIIKLMDKERHAAGYIWIVKELAEESQASLQTGKQPQEERVREDIRSQEIVIALDETGVMLNVSSSAVDLTGYSLEEQANCETPLDVVHPRDWPRVAAAINQAFAKPGSTRSMCFRYRHKGGWWAEFFAVGTVQQDRSGRRLLWATLCDPSQAPSAGQDPVAVGPRIAARQKRETDPQCLTDSRARSGSEDLKPGSNQTTILVVEDEAAMREMVVRFLNELDYRVLDAANGAQALELLKSHPEVALLFSDVMLPAGMNGPALVERARGIRPDLKVLYTSIYTEHYFAYSGELDRGARLLTKPYDKRTLAKHIRDALPQNDHAASQRIAESGG